MSNNIYDILNKLNSVTAATSQNILAEGKQFKSKDEFDDKAQAGDYYDTATGRVTKTDKGVKHERGTANDEKEELDEAREFSSKDEFDEKALPGDWCKTANGKLVKTASGVRHERSTTKSDNDELDEAREFSSKDEFDEKAQPGDYYDSEKGRITKIDKGVKHERHANQEKEELDEVAPPGAKAERMVKHIKKGYADDGKLTKREKGIAYATAWKAHNKGQVEEGIEFGDTIENSKAELKKAKKVKVTEGVIRNHPIYTTQEAWDHYAKELAEQEAMEGMTSHMHEPNIPSPTADQPVTKSIDVELDEIARLAGLAIDETDDELPPPPPHKEPIVLEDELEEEEMEEGNEFSGALAKAKAAGAKEFEVDGKKYTVKEDVNLTADTVDDVVGLIRKLAGLETVEQQPATSLAPTDTVIDMPADDMSFDGMSEERDIEFANTPDELVAPLAAATPNGTDLHRAKKSYSDKPYRGDNPMSVQENVEDGLWKKYSGMLKGLLK
jgi:hypothetical protein